MADAPLALNRLLRSKWVTAAALTALSLALGYNAVNKNSLVDSEAREIASASLPWTSWWRFVVHFEPSSLLFDVLLRPFVVLFGSSEASARSISVLMGALGVGVVYLTVRRLFGAHAALLASLLLAVNGTLITVQQTAGPYTLGLVCSATSIYVLVCAVEDGRLWRWSIFGVASGLTFYASPLASVTVVGAFLSIAVLPRRSLRHSHLLAAVAIWIVSSLPGLVLALNAHASSIDDASSLGWASLTGSAHELLGNATAAMGVLLLVVTFVGCLVGVLRIGKSGRSMTSWPYAMTLLWVLSLPTVTVVASIWHPWLAARYLVPTLPAVSICAVVVLFRSNERILSGVLSAGLVLLSMHSVANAYGNGTEEWRTAARFVGTQAQTGDGIVFAPGHREAFAYYFSRLGGKPGSAPAPLSPARPWGSDLPLSENRSVTATADALQNAASHYERMWFVYVLPEGSTDGIVAPLYRQYGSASRESFGKVGVVLFQQRS